MPADPITALIDTLPALAPCALPDDAPDCRLATADGERRLAEHLAQLGTAAADGDDIAGMLHHKAGQPTGFQRLLRHIHHYSPYLSGLLTRFPDESLELLSRPLTDSLAQSLTQAESAIGADTGRDEVMRILRTAKRRAHLAIAIADLGGIWSLDQTLRAISLMADTLIRLGVRHLLWRARAKIDVPADDPAHPEIGSGLIVLAMGKLGASELNYSSDIDLIVFYDGEAAPVDHYDQPGFYSRIARDLVGLLEQRTADGYVFRTDLRLRPDPASTPPAVSVASALTYYTSQALTWERAAMIKARPVIADPRPARRLMSELRRWVWRSGSDFTAVEDIDAVKRKIDANRPHGLGDFAGFNVKLGRGGIRQIEFLAQAHQLLFAGQDPGLRGYGTLAALDRLAESGRMPAAVASQLAQAYVFLRTVEHRLQMREDQQTHDLPREAEQMALLAASLGYADAGALIAELSAHLDTVAAQYGRLFGRSPSAPATITDLDWQQADSNAMGTRLEELGFADPPRAGRLISGWFAGQYRATRNERARDLLRQVVPALLDQFSRVPDPDTALLRFDAFLQQLPAGVPVLTLLKNSERLPRLFALILGMAPALADTVTRRPALLEAVLDPEITDRLPSRETLEHELAQQLATAQTYEDSLDIARRWVARRKFQGALHLLESQTPSERVGQFLARVAETGIAALQPLVETEFARRHGRFPGGGLAIVAMGNLASGQLTLTSDLDLVLVYRIDPHRPQSDGERPLHPNEYWIKFAARLVTAISALTAEGRMYEVDLRLRPQGDSGPLAVSLESFAQYQHSDAWTWEHMALTRARTITGDIDLKGQIEHIIIETLTRQRDPARLLADVREMRQRIETQHGTDSIWRLKYRQGGQIDTQFIAQYLGLRHAHSHPNILATSTSLALTRLRDAGLLAEPEANRLIEAHRLYGRLRHVLRLIMAPGQDFAPDTAGSAACWLVARAIMEDAFRDIPVEQAERIDFARALDHLKATIADVADISARILPPTPDPA